MIGYNWIESLLFEHRERNEATLSKQPVCHAPPARDFMNRHIAVPDERHILIWSGLVYSPSQCVVAIMPYRTIRPAKAAQAIQGIPLVRPHFRRIRVYRFCVRGALARRTDTR